MPGTGSEATAGIGGGIGRTAWPLHIGRPLGGCPLGETFRKIVATDSRSHEPASVPESNGLAGGGDRGFAGGIHRLAVGNRAAVQDR